MQERHLLHLEWEALLNVKVGLWFVVSEIQVVYVENPALWLIDGVLGALLKGYYECWWFDWNVDQVFPKILWELLHSFVHMLALFSQVGHRLDLSLIAEVLNFEEIYQPKKWSRLVNKFQRLHTHLQRQICIIDFLFR